MKICKKLTAILLAVSLILTTSTYGIMKNITGEGLGIGEAMLDYDGNKVIFAVGATEGSTNIRYDTDRYIVTLEINGVSYSADVAFTNGGYGAVDKRYMEIFADEDSDDMVDGYYDNIEDALLNAYADNEVAQLAIESGLASLKI
jgi:glyoxylase-like metal-dependent hydrolase (beta-lactamase superfamily II)